MELHHGTWVVPTGDAPSRQMAQIWQRELGAFGYRDGRLNSVGEHDDMVIASWYLEIAVRAILQDIIDRQGDEIVTMEELGIGRVRIGRDEDYPASPWARRGDDWY